MADPAVGPGAGPGLLDTLLAIARDLPGLLADRVELLSLELQRAGRALAQLLVLVVACAVLGVTAWLVLWAGIAGALVAAGLALHWALLVVLLANVLAIGAALLRMKRLLPLLRLPATRRHLTPSPSTRAAPDGPPQPATAAAAQPAAR